MVSCVYCCSCGPWLTILWREKDWKRVASTTCTQMSSEMMPFNLYGVHFAKWLVLIKSIIGDSSEYHTCSCYDQG